MGAALKKTGRDIVFNLCQYGMGSVWKWGSEAGNSWRTGPDLGTSTGGFIPGFYNIGLSNSEHWSYAHPGAWNDPDYINIGWVGGGANGSGKKTTFTNNEYYAYMSMWSMMASPLFFSGDMSRLDPFLLNVLCNHEVIAVDQDVLGRQGRIIRNDSTGMVMIKEMADGSKVIGFFNYPGDKKNPVDYFAWNDTEYGTRKMKISAAELGIKGTFRARNLWIQKDLGSFDKIFEAEVPYHGAVLIRISK
jgi:alpha-galactosidase